MTSVLGLGTGRLVTGAFRSLAELLVGGVPERPGGLNCDRLAVSFEGYVATLPLLTRAGLVWGMRALEFAPLLLGRHRLSRLGTHERARFLSSLERSRYYPLRAFLLGLKSAAVIVCFDDPAVESAIGYSHRCLLEDQAGP